MKQIILHRKAGAYSFSPIQDGEPSGFIRLIPDDGMALTDGANMVGAIDVRSEDIGLWAEIVKPPEPADIDPESIIAEMEQLI